MGTLSNSQVNGFWNISHPQMRIWMMEKIYPNTSLNNIGGTVRIKGPLDFNKLEDSINFVIKKNDAFRLEFVETNGDILQYIHDYEWVNIELKDFSGCNNAEDEFKSWVMKEAIKPFKINDSRLFHFSFFKISENDCGYLCRFHHLIGDGWTVNIGTKQIGEIYTKLLNNETIDYNETYSYLDFLHREKEYLASDKFEKNRTFWLDKFSRLPDMQTKNRISNIEGNKISFQLSTDKTKEIKKFLEKNKLSLNVFFVSLYLIYLNKKTQENDLVIGTPVMNRSGDSEKKTMGMFTSTMPFRYNIKSDEAVIGTMKDIGNELKRFYVNQKYPYELLLRDLNILKMGRDNLFDICINCYSSSPQLEYGGNLAETEEFDTGCQIFSLNLIIRDWDDANCIKIDFDYNLEEFTVEQIKSMYNSINTLIDKVLENPDLEICNISLLTEEEKRRLLYEFNDTNTEYPKEKTIHQLFEEQAEKTPDNIAVVFGNESITYRELNKRANKLAHVLREKGVRPDTIVGIIIERSVEMIVSILGILKAGGAYLPIDSEYPEERIRYMLEDSEAKMVLVCGEENKEAYDGLDIEAYDVLKESDAKETNHDNINSVNDLAYVIYTSGSTGKPKGVMIEHRSVNNFIEAMRGKINFIEGKTILCLTTICFDIFVLESIVPLTSGMKVILAGIREQTEPSEQIRLINEHEIKMLQATPSRIRALISSAEGQGVFENLEEIMVGGEELSKGLLNGIRENAGKNTRIYNMYGPTETTVWSTIKEVTREEIDIGRPIYNTRIYIVDRKNNLIPAGAVGELCIGGDGLARGYLKREELTAEKFVEAPFMDKERIYKTGDLARWLPDGNIDFLGRIDHQVKIRGYRIELGEIESQLVKIEAVKEAVVIAREDNSGSKYLCGYIVADREITTSEVRERLIKELPDYMVPSYLVQLEKLPLTPNGKVDRKALPELEGQINTGVEYVAPRNTIEEKIEKIWNEVLGLERAGIDDNFFELGGDSIKAIQIISRLRKYNMTAEVRDLFRNPTIRLFSENIKVLVRETSNDEEVLGECHLVPIQKWFFESEIAPKNYWNQSVMLYKEDGFDASAIRTVFKKIVEHHDALRMVFREVEGKIVQYNRAANEGELFTLEIKDLTKVKDFELRMKEEVERVQGNINLEEGPLVKLGLFRADKGEYLLIAIHHLVVDGVSWRIILEDFSKMYINVINSKAIELSGKSDSFLRWSEELMKYASDVKVEKERNYWEKLLIEEGLQHLPVDHQVDDNLVRDQDEITIYFTESETEKLLKETNKAYRTEVNDLLLSALAISIKKWCGLEKVIVNIEGHGRERIVNGFDISRTVGWFTTMYPVILNIKDINSQSKVIKTVKEELRRVPNKGVNYQILKYLKNNSEMTDENEAQITFNYLGQFDTIFADGTIKLSEVGTGSAVSGNSQRLSGIVIQGAVVGKQLLLKIEYNKKEYFDENIKRLAEIYSEVLRTLFSHCISKMETELTPSDLGDCWLSIEELEYLTNKYGKGNIENIYPLTPMQTGMLFHAIMDKGSEAFFEQTALNIEGTINLEKFKDSFKRIVERYTVLRTAILYENLESPRQVVLTSREISVDFNDIRVLSNQEKKNFIKECKEIDKEKGFSLENEPLLRLTVIQEEDDKYTLIWSFHHIIMDGWCLGIIFYELLDIYSALMVGKEPPDKKIYPYKDYISWLMQQDIKVAKSFWEKYLEEYSTSINIPADLRGGSMHKYENGINEIVISKELTQRLTDLAKRNRVTVNSVFKAIWGIILQRYNDTDDVVFGSLVSGRSPEVDGIEEMVGLFINTIPTRVKCDNEMTFTKLIKEIQENSLYAERYFYCPLTEIQSMKDVGNSLINHVIVFENYPFEDSREKSKWFRIQNIEFFEHSNFDFDVYVRPGEELKIEIKYNSAKYEAESVERIGSYFTNIAYKIAADEGILVSKLELASDEDKKRVFNEFSKSSFNKIPNNVTLCSIFERNAELMPNKIAIKHGEEKITYKQLNTYSNQIARVLRKMGIKSDELTAVMLERSILMVECILGTWKSGGAYIPIDVQYPHERIISIVKDSGAKVLLTRSEFVSHELLQSLGQKVIFLDKIEEEILNENSENIGLTILQGNLAYVIYTSGSTGKPKGAMVEHIGMLNHINAKINELQISNACVVAQNASHCFDISVWQFFTALSTGGQTVIYSDEDIMNPESFINKLVNDKVTVLEVVPSYLAITLDYLESLNTELMNIKYLLVTGEAVKAILIKRWFALYPDIKVVNAYGPTEASDDITHYIMDKAPDGDFVPIGRPLQNFNIYILDKFMNICPIGVKGEIFVSGIGVGRGYLNDIQKTDQVFSKDPFIKDKDVRLYKTGDLGRWLQDGNIQFFGRKDYQVKIRGFRIELGEIEENILKFPGIKEAIVIVREGFEGNKYLCAYISSTEEVNTDEIIKQLSSFMPEYMVPKHIVKLDKMPLSQNGKIDRKALPEIEIGALREREYIAPEDELEKLMAGIWQETIGADKVGINDNFFSIGGDSIKAIQFVSRMGKHNLKIDVQQVFEYPTISQLRAFIKVSEKQANKETLTGEVELLPMQKLLLEKNLSGISYQNKVAVLFKEDGFDEVNVKDTVKNIMQNHDALRAKLMFNDGLAIQIIQEAKDISFEFNVINIGEVDEYKTKIYEEITNLQLRLDIEKGLTVGVILFKGIEGDHLVIAIHAFAVDDISMKIIIEDFAMVYEQAYYLKEIKLPNKTDSIKTWYENIRTIAESKKLENEIPYWMDVMQAKIPLFPKDHYTKDGVGNCTDAISIVLSKEETIALQEANIPYNTRIDEILISALGMSLSEWTGVDIISINVQNNSRTEIVENVDISRTIGCLYSEYPLVLEFKDLEDISRNIIRVKETMRHVPNNGMGYGILKYSSKDSRSKEIQKFSLKPEIKFSYLEGFDGLVKNNILSLSPLMVEFYRNSKRQSDSTFEISVMIKDGELIVLILYSESQYDSNTVKSFVDRYKKYINLIIQHCIGKQEVQVTPSDFDVEDFSFEDLENISTLLEDI